MDLSTVKSVSPNRNTFKKIMAVLFSLTVIAVSFYVITNANKAAKDTVDVLRVKQDGGIPAYAVLTEKQLEKYAIIKKEYTSDMLMADDLSQVIGKFSKYYIRNNSVLYEDQLTEEKPLKNEWLYKLDEKKEVLTLPYNYLEAGGDILMPGDRVRIRVSYEVDGPGGNPNGIYGVSQGKITKTEILFDSIEVKDLLNANSHSIYEVYKEVLKLSEDKRQSVMKSENFLKNIQPRALLLEGSKEQIDNYAKYKGLESKSLLITILSRINSDVIVDQLPTLQKEVESWIDKQNAR
ncbi:hypothetical protein MUG84_08750 [Paenibacillus sp. KQZ6P-2]|uniref:Flagellar biosynthesis protein FlgA n=1 Tax=Paenibacillus mangrovi TaxID=2931978 RepID=A0A9X1WPZ2_9BACL|nr:hypothetical protein [Paenibacillus mangrovi]MCJ8011830.1 hypothetical protein [Paenibacillus mangrovi]